MRYQVSCPRERGGCEMYLDTLQQTNDSKWYPIIWHVHIEGQAHHVGPSLPDLSSTPSLPPP